MMAMRRMFFSSSRDDDDPEQFLSRFPFMDDILGEDPSITLKPPEEKSEGESNLSRVLGSLLEGDGSTVKAAEAQRVVAEGPKDDSAIYRAQEDPVPARETTPSGPESNFAKEAKRSFWQAGQGTLGISGTPTNEERFGRDAFSESATNKKPHLTPNFTGDAKLDTSGTHPFEARAALLSSSASAEEPDAKGLSAFIARSGNPGYDPNVSRLRSKQKQVLDRYFKFQKDWPAWVPIGWNVRNRVERAFGGQLDATRYATSEAEDDYWRRAKLQRETDEGNAPPPERPRVPFQGFNMGDRLLSYDPNKGTVNEVFTKPKEPWQQKAVGTPEFYSTGDGQEVLRQRYTNERGGQDPHIVTDEKGQPIKRPARTVASGGVGARPGKAFDRRAAWTRANSEWADLQKRAANNEEYAGEEIERYGSREAFLNARVEEEHAAAGGSPSGKSATPQPTQSQAQSPDYKVPFEQLSPEQLRSLQVVGQTGDGYVVIYQGRKYNVDAKGNRR